MRYSISRLNAILPLRSILFIAFFASNIAVVKNIDAAEKPAMPTTRPAVLRQTIQSEDGLNLVFMEEQRIVTTTNPKQPHAVNSIFILRIADSTKPWGAILWTRWVSRLEGVLVVPRIFAVQVEDEFAVVIYQDGLHSLGRVIRWKHDGSDPERLPVGRPEQSRDRSDFGRNVESATITGSYRDGTLRVQIKDSHGNTTQYRLGERDGHPAWFVVPDAANQ